MTRLEAIYWIGITANWVWWGVCYVYDRRKKESVRKCLGQ